MAIVRSARQRLSHTIEGDGGAVGYALAVPTRALRAEQERDLQDAMRRLRRELGVEIRYPAQEELDVLLDEAAARLCPEALPALAEVRARRERGEAGPEVAAETVEQAEAAAALIYDEDPAYREACRNRERVVELQGETMLRRFVLAIEGEAAFERPYGRLSDADLERIAPAHRLELVNALAAQMWPTDDEKKA